MSGLRFSVSCWYRGSYPHVGISVLSLMLGLRFSASCRDCVLSLMSGLLLSLMSGCVLSLMSGCNLSLMSELRSQSYVGIAISVSCLYSVMYSNLSLTFRPRPIYR